MPRTHPIKNIASIVLVAIGGFAGSNLRYYVELLIPSSLAATASVNILGCFLIGFFIYEELYRGRISRTGRTLIVTGFIASFTTYSTFVIDVFTSNPLLAIGYIIGSYGLGFAAVLLGRETARRVITVKPLKLEVND